MFPNDRSMKHTVSPFSCILAFLLKLCSVCSCTLQVQPAEISYLILMLMLCMSSSIHEAFPAGVCIPTTDAC